MPELVYDQDFGSRGRQHTHRFVDTVIDPNTGGRSFFDSTSTTRFNNRNNDWSVLPTREAFPDLSPLRSKSVGRRIMEDFGLARRRSESFGPRGDLEAVHGLPRGRGLVASPPPLPRFGDFENLGECQDCGAQAFRRAATLSPPPPQPLSRPHMERSRSSRQSRVNERYVYDDAVRDVPHGRAADRRRRDGDNGDDAEYWRREARKKKLASGAEAAIQAAAIEAFRLRKQPGSVMSAEKASRIATAAIGAGAIEGLIRGGRSDKLRRKLSSAVGGLVVNRLIHGPRNRVGIERTRDR